MAGNTLSPTELSSLIDDNGGYVSVKVIDRKIPKVVAGQTIKSMTVNDPNPSLEYTLRDGKKFTVHFDPGTPGADPNAPSVGAQWIVDDAGSALVDKAGAAGSAPITRVINGKTQQFDPASRSWIDPPGAAPASAPGPKTTVSGASAADQFIAQTDPTTGAITWIPNRNYVAPSPDTAALTQANTARDRLAWEQAQAKAKDVQAELQRQIDAGTLSNQQAISLFDKQLAALNFGETAGQDAVANAQAQVANQVGPHFGEHFAAGLKASATGDLSQLPTYDASDVVTPTPNYQAIAAAATARALAHLSPFAAQIAATMGSGGGDSGGASDAGAAPATAPAAAGAMIPNYAGPPGPANGWLPDAPGGQFTRPRPPLVGVGPYRPGG